MINYTIHDWYQYIQCLLTYRMRPTQRHYLPVTKPHSVEDTPYMRLYEDTYVYR